MPGRGLSFLTLVFGSNATLFADSRPTIAAVTFYTIHAYRYHQNVVYLFVRNIRGITFHVQAQSTRLHSQKATNPGLGEFLGDSDIRNEAFIDFLFCVVQVM